MSETPAPALRTGRFSFREPLLLCPRVTLYADRMVLEGWRWRGRFRRRIPLARIMQVDVTATGRLLVWLTSGETLRLRLDQAEAWKRAIETCRADSAVRAESA